MRKIAMLVIFIGFQALFSAVVLGKDLPDFPYSKDMDVVIVAKLMEVNGVPMSAYQFSSKEDEENIVEFYKDEWEEEMTDVLFGDWRILSHRDGDYLFTVQIEQNSLHITHGTLSVSPLFGIAESGTRKIRKLASNIGKDFMIPGGSEVINDIVSNDLGRESRTVFFSNSRSVAQNLSFYRSKMVENDGWAMLPSVAKKSRSSGAMALNKDGKEFNLSFVNKGGTTYGIAVSVR